MTLRHLEIFYALCHNDYNTTKAAAALNMTQPAVSFAIKELEQYYNVQLFDRIGRKLVITEAGKRFREYTQTITALFEDMEAEMRNWDKRGTIRVGATFTPGAMYLPFYIKKFEERYPEVSVQPLCAPANILEEKILDNKLDFAFSEGGIKNQAIVSYPYMDEYIAVIAAADGKYAPNQEISMEEFLQSRLILREKSSGTRKIFDDAMEKLGHSVEAYMESVSNTAIISAAASGIGLGVVSHRMTKFMEDEGLVVPISVKGLDLNRKFYIIHHKDKNMSQAAKNFLNMCNETNFEVE